MKDPVIQTYVWHCGKCFFVSTIERQASMEPPPSQYNETMVWAYDYEKRQRHELIGQGDCDKGNIWTHQRIVESLYKTGEMPEEAA